MAILFNPMQKANNRFKPVSLPSARKLFQRFGFSRTKGHPDNTDPYTFSEPSNSGNLAIHELGHIHHTLEYEAREYARSQAQEPEVRSPEDSDPQKAE